MRDTFYRLTDPILDRIPDISHLPKKRQVTIGIGASLLFHLLLLVFALIVGLVLPKRALINFAKSKPVLQEIELTIVPPEPEAQGEARLVSMEEIQNPTPFIDSRGLNPSDKASENPTFQSDVNMTAASELPATGDAPLPTQQGRTDREFAAFNTQQVLLGKTPLPFPSDVSLTPPSPPPAPGDPAPQSAPGEQAAGPLPMAHAEPTFVKPPAISTPAPQLAKLEKSNRRARPTPALKQVPKPGVDEIAVVNPPSPNAEPSPDETLTPPAPPMPMPRAGMPTMRATAPIAMQPQRVPEGYQPQQEKTRIEGSITNRGKASVDAVGTPEGRYRKAVTDAVGSLWYYYTKQKTDLIAPGSVRVSFSIDERGKVLGVRSENNTSNSSFPNLCEQAILEAELVPPPADILEPLLDGRLDFSITFSFHTF